MILKETYTVSHSALTKSVATGAGWIQKATTYISRSRIQKN